jgi:transposase
MTERRVYTAEFKREAVRLSEQAGVSVVQVAQELGVSDYSLYKWRKQTREGGKPAFPGNGKVALTAEQQENVRLKRELERVKQERDILKKAVGFFARESR